MDRMLHITRAPINHLIQAIKLIVLKPRLRNIPVRVAPMENDNDSDTDTDNRLQSTHISSSAIQFSSIIVLIIRFYWSRCLKVVFNNVPFSQRARIMKTRGDNQFTLYGLDDMPSGGNNSFHRSDGRRRRGGQDVCLL